MHVYRFSEVAPRATPFTVVRGLARMVIVPLGSGDIDQTAGAAAIPAPMSAALINSSRRVIAGP